MTYRVNWCVLILVVLSYSTSSLLAASPRLSIITPRGVQRGHDHELTFHGSRLSTAQEILFYQDGFVVKQMESDGNDRVKVTVGVGQNVLPGEYVAQVRTADGISDFRTFFVGLLPAVNEVEPNSDFDQPQSVELNMTVAGIVENEDVDYYAFELKEGQRLAVEIEALRLGGPLFDPYVAILDDRRFELSAADDTPLVGQDAIAAIVAPRDGVYVVQVRDSAYGGGGGFRYRLHAGTFPRPTAVYPAGGPVGKEIEVRFVGDPTGDLIQRVTLPAEVSREYAMFASDDQGMAPSANPFRLTTQENVLEQEPNHEIGHATVADTQHALNGVIGEPGDVDCFRFAATKGQVFDVECFARRLRTPLDVVMAILKADGGGLASNDDGRGLDSHIRFTVPEDGEYIVRVHDQLSRGAVDYVYRIEFLPVRPRLTLSIPRVERNGQYRQTIVVPRGNRFATLLNAGRAEFGGELVLEENDFPEGVSVHARPMPANLSTMPIVFEAAADAPVAGKLIHFTARHADESQQIQGNFENTADLVLGPPNNTAYLQRRVDRLAVAVVNEVPFHLEIVQPKAPVVRNGSMQLKIVARRQDGYKNAINVQLPFRPPGIGAASSVNIPEGQNEVLYPINANGGAQIGSWPIYAIGSADAGGAVWVSSQLAELKVAEPYVTLAMERAACEQGQVAQVLCKVNRHPEFKGSAKAQLLGLPNKVATHEFEIVSETEEFVFEITTQADSPVGKHKSLFCQLTVIHEGEPVVANAGGTELQIDAPLPPEESPAPAAEPKPAVAQAEQPQPKPKKPLTRLQKLRLQAKERTAKLSGRPVRFFGEGTE
ncbi:MAG: PPC domain-containing protein [Pirellulaceae bacterium]|nr:PPC domain-containing protein [Pirellulaceae bacterium]